VRPRSVLSRVASCSGIAQVALRSIPYPLAFLLLAVSTALPIIVADPALFDPETFTRTDEAPVTVMREFAAPSILSTTDLMRVHVFRVSSAEIRVNSILIMQGQGGIVVTSG